MKRITVLGGPPGSGKSTALIDSLINQKGRYLFASPTIDLIGEQYCRVREIAPTLPVRPVHSRNGQKAKVDRQIAALPDEFSPLDHTVAFVTHESLMNADLSGFSGWHLCIDEPPQSVACGRLQLATGWSAFQQQFSLNSIEGEWSLLVPNFPQTTWRQIATDSVWGNHTNFIKNAQRPQGVYVRTTAWEACKGRRVEWVSMWSPLAQNSFDSITVAGAGYLSSIGYKALASLHPDLDIVCKEIGGSRSAQPRIVISFFTEAHRGSTSFWDTSEGRRCLVDVGKCLAVRAPDLGYWSGNEAVRKSFEHRLPGIMTAPKIAGLNVYRDATSCAYFYSAKPIPEDETLKEIFGLTHEDIYAAREGEDLLQFVMRGAIRNPDYGGAYDIYLYSLDQAEFLRGALGLCGFNKVDLCPVPEAGLMEVTRTSRGQTRVPSQSELEERAERRRANSRKSSARYRAKATGAQANSPH